MSAVSEIRYPWGVLDSPSRPKRRLACCSLFSPPCSAEKPLPLQSTLAHSLRAHFCPQLCVLVLFFLPGLLWLCIAFSRMIMAPSRRAGVVASFFPLVLCFSSVLPRTDDFFPATAPVPTLSSSVLTSSAARYFFHISAASAAPAAAPSDGVAAEKSRAERLLKYAEQRAENAEEELKRFRQTHESSVRACSEASQRKQRELESCQEQSESFRKMYNDLQVTKSSLEKEVHSLRSRLAAASAAAGGTGTPADKNAATDETAKLRAEVKKLEERLQDMEDQHASEIATLQAKVRELLIQRELLKQQRVDGASSSEGQRHITSLSAMKTVLMDVGKLYRALGEQLLALVPAQWWEGAASMKMEAEILASPYINAVYEKVYVPLIPYVEHSKAFFYSRVYPLCAAVGRRAAAAGKTLCDDVVPAVNARLDAALQPVFAKHPDVELLVPSGLGDRLAVFLFLLLLTYFVALFSFRYVLFPLARAFLPCASFCGKRRTNSSSGSTNKRTRTGGSTNTASAQQKRFIPSGAAASGNVADNPTCTYSAAQGGTGTKKGQQHHNPARPFPFTDKYENAPVNMKKV